MASTAAHRSTGLAIGVIAAAIVSRRLLDPYHFWAIVTFMCAWAGGTAPDWLETAWWSRRGRKTRWIVHRSWTHWGIGWLALLVFSYRALGRVPLAALVFGFAAGGIMHLLADWPNPLGVPWLMKKRYSLQWWKSGRCDYLIIVTAWASALAIADLVWWQGLLRHQLGVAASMLTVALPHSYQHVFTHWLHRLT